MAGLYLHIPFCSQRCIYCDFYFTTTRKSHTSFVQALIAEIEYYGHTFADKEPIKTVYYGGGTPSLLLEDELFAIQDAIFNNFGTDEVEETTLELNPEDVDLDYLRGLRALGVDRLSIGIQSFFADDLAFLNRAHTAEQAQAIVPLAREAGFQNFSVDLIFGLPQQPKEYWAANLEKAVALGVPHMSAYGLTVEERTPLYNRIERGLVTPADEEEMADRYEFTVGYLRSHGYEQYEISNFALPGARSLHNSRYWEHKNYLGFGPSAHSFWWDMLPRPSAQRWSNVANLKQYEALVGSRQLPLDGRERLALTRLADEYIMLRLRTADGLNLDVLDTIYGVDLLTERLDEIAWLESEGYILPVRNALVRLTDSGRILCNSVTEKLMIGSLENNP